MLLTLKKSVLFLVLAFLAINSGYAQISSYCGSPGAIAYFVVGVRVPLIGGEKLIYDDFEHKFTNLKFRINGLNVSDSLLRAFDFSPKQLKKSRRKDLAATDHKNEFDFPYARIQVKSKIYLNGKLLDGKDIQNRELSKIKETEIISIKNIKPSPNKFRDFGRIEISTI